MTSLDIHAFKLKKCEINKKEKNEDGYTSLYAVTTNNVLKTVKI